MLPDERHGSDTNVRASSATELGLSATIVRVAWLAVLLGLGMELLLVIVIAGSGYFPGIKTIVADFVR